MPDPMTEDGWHIWDMTAAGTWPSIWPPVQYRVESDRRVALRATTPDRAGNLQGKIHGAFLAGLAEHAAGIFARVAEVPCVTISLAFDYPDAADIDRVLEGTVELMRETGRLQFVRVTFMQKEAVVIHGMATLRKFRA